MSFSSGWPRHPPSSSISFILERETQTAAHKFETIFLDWVVKTLQLLDWVSQDKITYTADPIWFIYHGTGSGEPGPSARIFFKKNVSFNLSFVERNSSCVQSHVSRREQEYFFCQSCETRTRNTNFGSFSQEFKKLLHSNKFLSEIKYQGELLASILFESKNCSILVLVSFQLTIIRQLISIKDDVSGPAKLKNQNQVLQ